MTTDSNFFDGLPCHLVMLLDIAFIRYSSFLLQGSKVLYCPEVGGGVDKISNL